jgi:hypothetical protein
MVTLVTYTSIHHVKPATKRRQPLAVHTSSCYLQHAGSSIQAKQQSNSNRHTHDGNSDAVA